MTVDSDERVYGGLDSDSIFVFAMFPFQRALLSDSNDRWLKRACVSLERLSV